AARRLVRSLLVALRAARGRKREAAADLDAFHRLDAHEREREPGVEPVLLRRVRAEPGWDAGRAYLDDAADRVTLGARLVDVGPEPLLVDDRARHLDPDRREQRLGNRAG